MRASSVNLPKSDTRLAAKKEFIFRSIQVVSTIARTRWASQNFTQAICLPTVLSGDVVKHLVNEWKVLPVSSSNDMDVESKGEGGGG